MSAKQVVFIHFLQKALVFFTKTFFTLWKGGSIWLRHPLHNAIPGVGWGVGDPPPPTSTYADKPFGVGEQREDLLSSMDVFYSVVLWEEGSSRFSKRNREGRGEKINLEQSTGFRREKIHF